MSRTFRGLSRLVGVGLVCLWAVLASTPTALACGEPLFKMGKGARYRSITAPLPARVLVYAPASSGAGSSFSQLPGDLRKAGHHVTEVMETAEVESLLREGSYDIVIAGHGDALALRSTIESAPSRPEVLPVVSVEASNDRALRAAYSEWLVGAESLRQSCKKIHQIMEARSK